MTKPEFKGLEELGSPNVKLFEAKLSTLEPGQLGDCLLLLSSADALPRRERDRRARAILSRIPPTSENLPTVIQCLRDTSPDFLNAVRAALPPELRPLARVDPGSFVRGIHGSGEPEPNDREEGLEPRSSYGTVLLVGAEFEHANNKALLSGSGFQFLRVRDIQDLIQVGDSGLCGFVVTPSVWGALTEDEQRDSLRFLTSHSTFWYARVATERLVPKVARELPNLLAESRCPDPVPRFSHSKTGELTEADITGFIQSAARMEAAREGNFFLLGLDDDEALLLRLVVGERCRSLTKSNSTAGFGARMLFGGRSGAKVYHVEKSGARPIVVKLESESALSNELRRYQQFIKDWEDVSTDPILHRHLGRAAISYRLQVKDFVSNEPAPTLEEAIERLRRQEWHNDERHAELENDLTNVVNVAADCLSRLNKRAPDAATDEEFWLHWPAKEFRARSLVPVLAKRDGNLGDLWDFVLAAEARIRPLHGVGVIHGDLHARNILLMDRTPTFVDYAMSGPGNPLVDLTRLDAAVRTGSMRSLLPEETMVQFYTALYIEGAPAEALLRDYPVFERSSSCRLSIHSACHVRNLGLQVASHHGFGLDEFLSTAAVVSAFCFCVFSPGSLVERALLTALMDHSYSG